MRADLHTHTWYSPDGLMPPELLMRLALRRGIRILAITDHNRLTLVRSDDLILVPGEEIMTTWGEIIGLGLSEEIPRGLSPEETADRIREQGGVVVLPHPFDRFRRRTALLLNHSPPSGFHVVEVLNARYVDPASFVRAYVYAREKGLPMVASSDAHTPWEVGNAYTHFPPDVSDVADVLQALRRGKVRPAGHMSSPLVHGFSFIARALHRIGLFKPRGAPSPVLNP